MQLPLVVIEGVACSDRGFALSSLAMAAVKASSAAPKAAPAPNETETKLCPKCNVDKDFTGQCCRECNTFKVKSYRKLLEKGDEELTQNWADMDRTKKQEIYRDCHHLVGDHLLAAIKEAVTETDTESLKKKLLAKGAFKDAIDMDKAYKDKPEQLVNIYENSMSMVCPIKKVKMWVDPEFTSETSFSQEKENKRTLTVQTEHKRKKLKTDGEAKVKGKGKGNTGEGTGNPVDGSDVAEVDQSLTKEQRAFMKAVEDVGAVATEMHCCIEEAKQMASYMPQKVILDYSKTKIEIDESCATFTLEVQADVSIVPSDFKKKIAVLKKSAKASLIIMKKRVALAAKEAE